jgi:hypothetical protein
VLVRSSLNSEAAGVCTTPHPDRRSRTITCLPARSTEPPAPERSGVQRLSTVPALSINPARRHGPRTSILKPIERQCGRRHAPLDTPLSETPTDDWRGSPFTQGSRPAARRPGAPRSLQ